MPKKKASPEPNFSFEISLSVLNHLGRNLYRSFVTVLGEAISNSWDADAKNVWIEISKNKNSFIIKDDGIGMTAEDFQDKFLRIGYSKRKDGNTKSLKGRPFIGRKGIGKLALLSCAEQVTVISKTKNSAYIGGVIDNAGLDDAITNDLKPQQYPLEKWNKKKIEKHTKNHIQGTIIQFDNIKGGIKNSLSILKKIIALYFRFSLIDETFNIYLDGEKITYKNLKELADKTEFCWTINKIEDPYVNTMLKSLKEKKLIKTQVGISGFIASVVKPRDLNIMNIEERTTVDLFVNGRLREKDILKHIPTARIVEDYLYGQIHFNELDEKDVDRFTSNREGVISDDEKYQAFLKILKEDILKRVIDDWDKLRRKSRQDGDPENESITPKERKAEELYNVVSSDYIVPKGTKNSKQIAQGVDHLMNDAKYNFGSYAECFIAENLIREYIQKKKIRLSPEANTALKEYKKREKTNKGKGNISIEIRQKNSDLSYLSMDDLAYLVDKKDPNKEACLARDANEYKPIRDALMHTALLSDKAKLKLSTVYENIKDRIKILLTNSN